ncbi:hypothetical protein JCM1840_002337 [Sporobolomyces johnsonii]
MEPASPTSSSSPRVAAPASIAPHALRPAPGASTPRTSSTASPVAHALSDLSMADPSRPNSSLPSTSTSIVPSLNAKRRRSSDAPEHKKTPSGSVVLEEPEHDGVVMGSSLLGYADGIRSGSGSRNPGPDAQTAQARTKTLSPSSAVPARPNRPSPTHAFSRPSPPPLSLPSFPVLPPSIPSPSQTYQTPCQVSSILSLPAPLLLQLARTASPAEQQQIAQRAGRSDYLGSMALPPPSPTTLVNDIQKAGLGFTPSSTPGASSSSTSLASSTLAPPTSSQANSTDPAGAPSRRSSISLSVPLAPVTGLSSHPAIPLLLGQVFSPPTPGVLAPIPGIPGVGETLTLAIRAAARRSRGQEDEGGSWDVFEPIYASVEDWSYKVAKDQVFSSSSSSTFSSPTSSAPPASPKDAAARPSLTHSRSFNEREIAHLAAQMKSWALAEQEKQVEQQVVESRSAAVVLAAEVAVRQDEDQAESGAELGGGGGAGGDGDFSAYAEAYKRQLDALASGYFAQLHRDALKRLVEKVEEGRSASSSPQLAQTTAFPAPDSTVSSSTTTTAISAPSASTSAPSSSLPPLSSSHAPSLTSLTSLTHSRPHAEALHIQASAAAAVAANVMAAKEMSRHAGEKLVGMGVDPKRIVEEVGIGVGGGQFGGEGGNQGMKSLEISPESIRAPSSSTAEAPAMQRTTTSGDVSSKDKMVVEDIGVVSAPAAGKAEPAALASALSIAQMQAPPPAAPSTSQPEPSTVQADHALPLSPIHTDTPSSALPPTSASTTLSDPTLLASVASPQKRDYLLSYAHTLYAKDPGSSELLPLLHTIESIHPDHLPTLLLISCVYYTRGELESSLYYNKRLLAYDPSYVEAMSNIGTTLRAMGKWSEAETWWWKAIKLRPTYWDATENLLGVLCNPSSAAVAASPNEPPPPSQPRYAEALSLCDYVEAQIYAVPPSAAHPAVPSTLTSFVTPLASLPRPRTLPSLIPFNNVHRVQNLFYAKGNLRLALGDPLGALDGHEKAVEVALALPDWAQRIPGLQWPIEGCTTRDLVVVATVVGKILAAFAQSGANQQDGHLVSNMARQLGVADERGGVMFERLFPTIKTGGDAYVRRLLDMGNGVLPTVLLEPTLLSQFPGMLFAESRGTLPSMFDPALVTPPTADGRPAESDPGRKPVVQSTNQTTSTMLLTIAKILQDSLGPTSATHLSLGGIPASQSLLLPLYYIALALYPSPSTCNNLGILLSTMNATTLIGSQDPSKPPMVLTGQQLALKYYEAGLKLDPKHPHLYTNLGSLLKDMGQLPQAVAMYKRAVDFNPTFDVALANLANAVKDTGQIQESIPYYRRAVQLNPNFPEAVCGLVNALGGVCDWQGRGGVNEEWIVDVNKQLVHLPTVAGRAPVRSGYMAQISDLVAKQLKDGLSYGVGSLRTYGGVKEWLAIISQALYDASPEAAGDAMKPWLARLSFLLGEFDRSAAPVNEGGYLIRLIERLMRRIQRRWYLAEYGPMVYAAESQAPKRIMPTQADAVKYRRPLLPPSLPPIPVPTVLPFHCFTLPVTARETRLISHRTGLRISHSTLNQPWMPPIVYPPPRPPLNGKINLGYVSSDLGNHPLSHLMQSVFGYHDLSRFNVFVYATSPSDKSPYRLKIESESQHFVDVSAETTQQIVDRIVRDEIHVLVNLSGYTKGARNEVFAARPAPVQMSYMGFASTLSAGWCDYFIVDPIVCPPHLVSGNQWRFYAGLTANGSATPRPPEATDFEGDLDPEGPADSFVYTEKLIYLPHSYFVTDHKQAWREDEDRVVATTPQSEEALWALEEDKRWKMRKQMFPELRDDTVIFANWNQLYKIDPFIYRIWLSILKRFPNSILWLLRFPAPGEAHLKETARQWAGEDVAKRVIFTDVANKNDHIHRGRIADLFLDTTECNAHTTAADILWSGTPILTFPRHPHKMCSRVAASIAVATGFGPEMIVSSPEAYEERALALAAGLDYELVQPDGEEGPVQRRSKGELAQLRKKLFLTRERSPLFDTRRWTGNLEKGLIESWERWVRGQEFEDGPEFGTGPERATSCIWVEDSVDSTNIPARKPYF